MRCWWIAIGLAGCWTGQEPPAPRPTPPPPPVVAAAPRAPCPVLPDGDVEHGRKLVRTKHCLFCHRPRVAASMARACDATGIRLAIINHTDTSNLSPTDLDDLVAYVASAW